MKKLLLIVVATLFVFVSCNKRNNAIDEAYYQQVESDFNEVKKRTTNRSDALFKVFDKQLSDDESRYLKFLYAYMPM